MIAVIGNGRWSQSIVKTLKRMKLPFIVVSRRSDDEACSFRSVMNDPSVTHVIVATEAKSHFNIALDCIKSGKHVLIEKPMTTNSKHAVLLYERAAQKNVFIMDGCLHRFNKGINSLHEKIGEEKIRQVIINTTSDGPVRRDVNIAWDFMPHDVTILVKFLGWFEPTKVLLRNGNYIAYFRGFSSVAITKGSWKYPKKQRLIKVLTAERCYVFDDVAKEIKIYKKGRLEYVQAVRDDPLKKEIAYFMKKSGAKHPIADYFGLGVVETIEKIQELR